VSQICICDFITENYRQNRLKEMVQIFFKDLDYIFFSYRVGISPNTIGGNIKFGIPIT